MPAKSYCATPNGGQNVIDEQTYTSAVTEQSADAHDVG